MLNGWHRIMPNLFYQQNHFDYTTHRIESVDPYVEGDYVYNVRVIEYQIKKPQIEQIQLMNKWPHQKV